MTQLLERPKTKQQLAAQAAELPSAGSRESRIAESVRIQNALIARIRAATGEDELRALVIEMEAMPVQTLHHMAKLNIRDAWRTKLSQFYPVPK